MAYGTRRAALQRRTTFGGGYGGGGVSPFSLPYPPGGGQGQALQLNTSDIARAGTAAKLELYKINSDWQHRSLEGQRQFIMDQARNRIEQQKINQDEEFRWRKLDADKTDAAARLAQQEFSNTMALGHFGLSQGTAAAAATTREENNAADRVTAIRALVGTGDPPLTEAEATAEVDRQLPHLKPGAPGASGGQLPEPPTAQAPPATPGSLPAPPTGGTQPPAPPQQAALAPLTPAQIEGIRQKNLVAGRDATIRQLQPLYGGQAGAMAPPVPGVPNWITDPKTGKLVMVPGQPLANIPIFERTVEQLNGQLPLPTAPTQDLAPFIAAAQARNANQGVQSASMAGTLNARATGIQGMQAVGAGPQAAEQAAMKQEAALQGKGPALGPYERTVAAQAEAAIAANAPIPGPAPQPPPRRKGWKEELPDDETRGWEGIQETVSAPVAWLLDKLGGPRSASGAKGAPAPGGYSAKPSTQVQPNPLAPPTAAPQATPGTLPPPPQETPTPLERAAQGKRNEKERVRVRELYNFLKGEMDSFKTIPEKPDRNMKNTEGKLMFSNTPKGDAAFNAAMEEYEKYAPLKKRYNAAKKRYNELLPQLEEEDAASTQTLTTPTAKEQATFQALRKDPDLTQYSNTQLWDAIRG